MKLLYPEFLYAFFFLAIPIIIHLFNFRKYKVIRFPQLRFLQEIQQQSSSSSRLKHLLVLLSRLLALSALIIAFTQPYLPSSSNEVQEGKKGVSIYIDNSFSMEAKASGGQLLDIAKNQAISIIEAYDASDKFQLLTNDFEVKHQRWMNKDQFIQALQNVTTSAVYRKLSEVIKRQDELFKQENIPNKRYIISDLQKVSFDFDELKSNTKINLIPTQVEDIENIKIDHLTFSRPYHSQNSGEEIQFSAFNFGNQLKEDLNGQLFLNNKLKSPFSLTIEARDSVAKQIAFKSFNNGWQKGEIVIKDYPVNFDDTIFFSYPIITAVNVLHLFEERPHPSFAKLFKADTLINYQNQNINQFDLTQLGKQNLIILESIKKLSSGLQANLTDFVHNGGSICLFPDADADLESINYFLESIEADRLIDLIESEIQLSELNENALIFEGVFDQKNNRIDLPKVSRYWQTSNNSRLIRSELMTFRNGNSFLKQYQSEEGKTYLFSIDLDNENTNFSRHAIFVPTLYNMALQSIGSSKTNHYTNDKAIIIKNTQSTESPIRLIGQNQEIIPPQQNSINQTVLNLSSLNLSAGHYELKQEERFMGYLSLNFNRKESDPATYKEEELNEIATTKGINLSYLNEKEEALMSKISTLEEGTPLWKYFIIFALVFLAIEVAFLRLLK